MENEVNVTDLISLAYDQKPVDFQNVFDQLIKDKIADAIDNKKTEIAKTMFGGSDDFSYDDQEEDDVAFEDEEEYEFDQEEQQDGENAE